MNILRWTTTIGRVLGRFLGWLVGQGRRAPGGPSRGPRGAGIGTALPHAGKPRAYPPSINLPHPAELRCHLDRSFAQRRLAGVFNLTPFVGVDRPNVLPDGKAVDFRIDQPIVAHIQPASWRIPQQFFYHPRLELPDSCDIELGLPSEPSVVGQVRLRRRDALRLKGRARRLGQQPPPTPTADDELWQQVWAILSLPPRIDELVQIRYPDQLRAYQVEGVKLLIEKERFLLADEMGTGKTVQACVALSLLIQLGRVDRALVLCPKTVLPVWLQHLVIWLPEATCHNHEHLPARFPRDRARVWILPYSRVRVANALERWGNDWDVVIMDEVHELRNPLTRGYQAVSQMVVNARYRWGLSGTPLQNRLEDLSAIYGIIRPELNLRAEFLGAAATREAIRPYLRRISRESALADLPPKTRQEIWLRLDTAQRKAYQQITRLCDEAAASGDLSFTKAWDAIQKLMRICNFAPGSSTSPKLRTLLKLIDQIVNKGEKVVVFSRFREAGVDDLFPHLRPYGVALIHGNVHINERIEAIRRFQSDPRCRVFLGTVFTSGHGLTLTAANHVVHFDHWWNPAVVWQAEDRVYRFGQTKPVTVYDLWMEDTVEERILEVLKQKGLLHQQVIEALAQKDARQVFTLEDLAFILGLEVKARTGRVRKKS